MRFKCGFSVNPRHWIFHRKSPKIMDFPKILIFRLVFMVYGGFKMVYIKTCGETTLVFGKTMKNHSENQFGCRETTFFWKLSILKNSIFWSFESQTSHKPKCGLKWFFGGLTKFFKNFRKFWTFLQLTFFLYDAYLLISRTISHFKFLPDEYLAATVKILL